MAAPAKAGVDVDGGEEAGGDLTVEQAEQVDLKLLLLRAHSKKELHDASCVSFAWMHTLRPGLTNLFEPDSYFKGTGSYEGQPVSYSLLKWHSFSVCL